MPRFDFYMLKSIVDYYYTEILNRFPMNVEYERSNNSLKYQTHHTFCCKLLKSEALYVDSPLESKWIIYMISHDESIKNIKLIKALAKSSGLFKK